MFLVLVIPLEDFHLDSEERERNHQVLDLLTLTHLENMLATVGLSVLARTVMEE